MSFSVNWYELSFREEDKVQTIMSHSSLHIAPLPDQTDTYRRKDRVALFTRRAFCVSDQYF